MNLTRRGAKIAMAVTVMSNASVVVSGTMKTGKYIWMAVTADEFELPLCVADSARKLGEKFGVTADTVMTLARAHLSGRTTGRRFVKVRNDDWKRI